MEPTTIRHPLALRLYFGHLTTPERLEEMLETFIEETEKALGDLAVVQEFTENMPGHEHSAVVAEWSYAYHQAELNAARKALKRIKN